MTTPRIEAILYQLQGDVGLSLNREGDVLLVDQNKFPFKAQQEFRPHQFPNLLALKQKEGKFLVIANRIYTSLKDKLRAANIAYIDGAGNAYLKDHGLFVFIDGKKGSTISDPTRHKAFTKTGLRIVFHFLLYPNLLKENYRTIASELEVSLDSVSKTIASLKTLGFIVMLDKKQMRLIKQKALLDRWLYQYGDKLKPSLLIGQFRFLGKDWKKLKLNPTTQWGGEAGADLLTNYLHPEIWTMYSEESRKDLMKNYRLLPDENGTIEIYQRFWNQKEEEKQLDIVPAFLVYADLMYSGDPRNIETAQRIYEQYLQDQFSETA